MMKRLKNIGPGALVAAAFVGPGTITTCTLAGVSFGYALLWSLVFATVTTIILQEMSARLGIITQKGLGEILAETLSSSPLKWPLFGLIILAMYVGNGAYEAGNLSGAALGIQALAGETDLVFRISIIAISAVAAGLLFLGTYKQIEIILLTLVLLMAVSFVATFIMVKPDLAAFGRGLVVPELPSGSGMIVIALIGTTVVPYNLFLHASAVKTRWDKPENLNDARVDTVAAIGIGGLITIFVAGTAAASALAISGEITSAADMAKQVEPLYGAASKYLLGIGFFAAGLSSGIAAPLATGYIVSEILGLKGDVTSFKFRLIMMSIIIAGAGVALTGIKPITIIVSAQFANGLLLPLIAGFLLFAMNRKALLGIHANGIVANILGGGIVIVMIGLGLRLVLRSLGSL